MIHAAAAFVIGIWPWGMGNDKKIVKIMSIPRFSYMIKIPIFIGVNRLEYPKIPLKVRPVPSGSV